MLVGFANGPMDDPTTWGVVGPDVVAHNNWTNISAFVDMTDIGRGRQHELSRFESGSCDIPLSNEDGRFNSWNASGPYYGHLKPKVLVQVRTLTPGGTTSYRFSGHSVSWQQIWPDETSQAAVLTCNDAFKLFNAAPLTAIATYDATVLVDGASNYWPCDDAPGVATLANLKAPLSVATLLSASGQLPAVGGVGPLLRTPNSGAVNFGSYNSAGLQGWANIDFDGINGAHSFSAETWFQVPPGSYPVLIDQNKASALTHNSWMLFSPWYSSVVFQVVNAAGVAKTVKARSPTQDGMWHHAVVTYSTVTGLMSLYVDGIFVSSTAHTTGIVFAAHPTNGVHLGSGDSGGPLSFGGCTLSRCALYDGTVLTAAQVLDHFTKGAGFAQELAGARVGHVLDAMGWSGQRHLDTGVQACQANTGDLQGALALSLLQAPEITEGGALFMDGQGYVTFLGRDTIATGTRQIVAQATFGDVIGDGISIPFRCGPDLGIDDTDIVTSSTVTRQGGQAQTYAVTNEFSPVSQSLSGVLHLTDAASLAHATWIVTKLAEPLTRLRTIHVAMNDFLDNPTFVDQVLGLRLMDRVVVNRTQIGFTQTALIEHITEKWSEDGVEFDFALSPTDIFPDYRWGDLTRAGDLADFLVAMQATPNLVHNGAFINAAVPNLPDGCSLYGTPTIALSASGLVMPGSKKLTITTPLGSNQAVVMSPIPMVGNGWYSCVSAHMRVTALSPGADVTLVAEFYNADDVLLDYTYVKCITTDGSVQLKWGAGPVPIGTTYANIRMEVNGGGSATFEGLALESGYGPKVWSDFGDTTGRGWIGVFTDQLTIHPYGSNIGALGLAMAAKSMGVPSYADAAWAWLHWYKDHMDPTTGYVTDYALNRGTQLGGGDGTLVSTGDMDSTDAYAGTFLMALRQAWLATADLTQLTSFHAAINLAVTAIASTQQSDGLTWAKPAYQVKYLEDQCETYAGLNAAVQMFTALGDATNATLAQTMATNMANGIETYMWNAGTSSYDWAIDSAGTHTTTNWANINDTMQNAWAVAYGLATGTRAVGLMNQIRTSQPSWPYVTTPDIIYNPVIAAAFYTSGFADDWRSGLAAVLSHAATNHLAYPFACLEAGGSLLAMVTPGLLTGLADAFPYYTFGDPQ